MKRSYTTPAGRHVKIKLVNLSGSFGHIGVVIAANGKKIGETRLFPWGFQGTCLQAAEALADKLDGSWAGAGTKNQRRAAHSANLWGHTS